MIKVIQWAMTVILSKGISVAIECRNKRLKQSRAQRPGIRVTLALQVLLSGILIWKTVFSNITLSSVRKKKWVLTLSPKEQPEQTLHTRSVSWRQEGKTLNLRDELHFYSLPIAKSLERNNIFIQIVWLSWYILEPDM